MTFESQEEKLDMFNALINLYCGMDEQNKPVTSVGLMYSILAYAADEEEDNTLESRSQAPAGIDDSDLFSEKEPETDSASLFEDEEEVPVDPDAPLVELPTDLLTLTKPEVSLSFFTDYFQDVELCRIDLKFASSYDPDIRTVNEYLTEYMSALQESYFTPITCPNLTLLLMSRYVTEMDDPFFMRFDSPLFFSLTSSKPNTPADTVTMVFFLQKMNPVFISKEDIKAMSRQLDEEDSRNEREMMRQMKLAEAQSESREAEREKELELMRQANELDNRVDTPKRVGRGGDFDDN